MMMMKGGASMLVVLTALAVVGILASAALHQSEAVAQQGKPYSLEGAWMGTATIYAAAGFPDMQFPTMDTFTSDLERPKHSGTFLCTVPGPKLPHPMDPTNTDMWISVTQSGQGNWTRIGTNDYAFTAWRIIVDQQGWPFGRAKYWGIITTVSDDEYSGTIHAQFYAGDGTPLFPAPFNGSLSSRRIEVEVP
jgi:hypothetical protein